ncbi:hypothetical protein AB0G32_03780 [Streptomyces sp. NPDC023723]|uniref:hypothetical protein n=1 Tax=Streptomyces sp. NPDC023723 TaxID=3154323 RepID=UPI0033F2BBC0
MVSSSHEAMHRIFQDHPTLFSRVSDALGLRLPPPVAVSVLPNDVTETEPIERRIDTLLRIETRHDGPFLLAIEAQRKKDPEKSVSWSYYLAYLRSKYRLPPLLLVVCQDHATAEWAARPEPIGFCSWPSLTVRPIVAGPHNMPVITEPDQVREDFALAALAAIVHGTSPDIEGILKAMSTALMDEPEAVGTPFVELIFRGLGKLPAAEIWSKLVVVDLDFYQSDFMKKALAKARAEGLAQADAEVRAQARAEVRAQARAEVRAEVRAESEARQAAKDVLAVLDKRGIDVPQEAREHITHCTDPETLHTWLLRAVTATSLDEVLE